MTVLKFVFKPQLLWLETAKVPRISVTFVPPCVKLVLQNVTNFKIRIVKSALIFVALVQKYADKWLHKIILKKKLCFDCRVKAFSKVKDVMFNHFRKQVSRSSTQFVKFIV